VVLKLSNNREKANSHEHPVSSFSSGKSFDLLTLLRYFL
jgi:hypothetical protein